MKHVKPSYNIPRSHAALFIIISLAAIACPQSKYDISVSGAVSVSDALNTPRVFTRGSFVYLADRSRIIFLSTDTRGSHTLYAAPDPVFNISDAVRGGDMIWAVNGVGAVMGIDMQTGTIEEYGRGRVSPGGRIDADRRYLWLAAADTLYRMDLSSREWVSIPVPKSGGEIRALVSFNDRIHIIMPEQVLVYRPLTGDWVFAPHSDFTLGAGNFYKVGNTCYFTQGETLYSYDPSKMLWNRARIHGDIRAAHLTSGYSDVAAEDRIYQYNERTLTLEPLTRIPMLRGIRSITRHYGRTVCAVDGGLAFFNPPFDIDFARYPGGINPDSEVFAFSYQDHIILYATSNFYFYHQDRKLWSVTKIVNRNKDPGNRAGWDEDGARGYFTDDHKYTLNGTATLRQQPSYNSDTQIDLGKPLPNMTLNMRTEDAEGRTLDLTLDNAVTTLPPQKGFYYKGLEEDVFDRASFGIQEPGLTSGRLVSGAVTEGAKASFSGTETARGRDRAVVSGSAGGGFILSQTQWATFNYNSGNVYHIYPQTNTKTVPSSVKVYVDGEELSGTDFIYNPAKHEVRILRRDRSDPTSVVQISFTVTSQPENPVDFEPFPENHYGQYGFVEGTLSPRQWLSARAGVLALDDGMSGTSVLAGVPTEWRSKDGSRSVLLDPEVVYDAKMGTHAAGVTLGAHENRAFGSYRGYWASRDFEGIDRYMFGGYRVGDEHELDFGYDIRDDLRTTWYQQHRSTEGGDISNFGLRANYTGGVRPDIEVSAASRLFESGPADMRVRDRKETFNLRLSDLSSDYLIEQSGMHNVGYDFTLTEYRAGEDQNGRTVYGLTSVSPIDRLTFTGSGMYRVNPQTYQDKTEINPMLSVYMHDLPQGVDMNARYGTHIYNNRNGGYWVWAEKFISALIYPGEYVNALDKFAIYMKYYDVIDSPVDDEAMILKQSFFTYDNTYSRDIWETVELIFFPTERLLLSTFKERNRSMNDPARYYSRERAKWWFESGSSAEGRFHVEKRPDLLRLRGETMYEHRWNETLMTGVGGVGVRHSENHVIDIHGGPQFIASLTKNFNGFVRTMENSHQLQAMANRKDMKKPDVHYVTHLRLKMPPNISLVGELSASTYRLRDKDAGGGIYLHAGF